MQKKYPLKKINNQFFFVNEDVAKEYNEDYEAAGNNPNIIQGALILETRTKRRSISANNYYWGFVNKAIAEHLDIDPKTLHYKYLLPWFSEEVVEKENKNKFKILLEENNIEFDIVGSGSSQMNTKEFWGFIEQVRKWASGPSDPDGIVSKTKGLELYIAEPKKADGYWEQYAHIID